MSERLEEIKKRSEEEWYSTENSRADIRFLLNKIAEMDKWMLRCHENGGDCRCKELEKQIAELKNENYFYKNEHPIIDLYMVIAEQKKDNGKHQAENARLRQALEKLIVADEGGEATAEFYRAILEAKEALGSEVNE